METWELRLECCKRVADVGPPCPVIVVCSLLLSGCKPNITGSYIVSRHSIIPACNDNTAYNFHHIISLFSCLLDCGLSCAQPAMKYLNAQLTLKVKVQPVGYLVLPLPGPRSQICHFITSPSLPSATLLSFKWKYSEKTKYLIFMVQCCFLLGFNVLSCSAWHFILVR